MKKIRDFNNATEKYPVIYAGSATRPEFVGMPTTPQQKNGVAPMDTLPAQWWNAMWKLATKDINAFRDYVGDSITEINNLLTKFGITLDDADSGQLYYFFHNDYVQNYLNDIFVNKSGDTIDGDLHVKGNLSVDGIGEEIISTELKVGANTITLRNGNPSALGNTELAGVVTENYDGNNHNNIISIDKNGVARVGDIDIATRILYSNNGTNFFTDENLTIPATIGTDENVRDTGNQTSGGVKIYEGVTYSNNDTQALATREDTPVDGALMKWDAASKKLVSADIEFGVPVDVVEDGNMRAVTSNAVYGALTDAATIQQALQLPGVLSGAVAAGDNKAVKSSAVNAILQFFTQNQPRADFNDCNNAPLGFACSNNLANAPLNTSDYVYLLTLNVNNDSNYLEQLAFINSSIDTYRRIKAGGNWTSWYKIALSNELVNKSYGEDIAHSNGQYAKLTIIVDVAYTTSIIALMGRGASLALIGICANDSDNANVRTYLKDEGSYENGAFFYKPISKDSIELYWYVGTYSTISNYQIITNTKNTILTADIVNSLPEGAIQL